MFITMIMLKSRFRKNYITKIAVLSIICCIVLITSMHSNSTYYDENDTGVIDEEIEAFSQLGTETKLNRISPQFSDDGDSNTRAAIGERQENGEEEEEQEEEDEKWDENKLRRERVLAKDRTNRHRLSKAIDQCTTKQLGHAMRIVVEEKRKSAATCLVPGAGDSYWRNVFRFINNKTDGDISLYYNKPADIDIPRFLSHPSSKLLEYTLNAITITKNDLGYFRWISFLGDSFRFMFVLHPLRRLWSAWVDKFILPEFWFDEAHSVAHHLKFGANFNHECPTNITFDEFLRYVTHPRFEMSPSILNENWKPIRLLCDPCIFHPHFIGKMETFSRDAQKVFTVLQMEQRVKERQRMKIKHKAGNSTQAQDTVLKPELIWSKTKYYEDIAVHQMLALTAFNLDLVRTPKFASNMKNCRLEELFVAKRLWKAFRYKGYIRFDRAFPAMTQWTIINWHRALLKAYAHWPEDKRAREKEQQDQKEKLMKAHYKRIPLTTLLKVKDMFWHDYVQFGYKPDL